MSNAIVFQKLETITIVQTNTTAIAGGTLRIDPDVGIFHSIRFGLRVGEQMGFGSFDDWLVRFDDHVMVTLFQESFLEERKKLGSVTVPSSELNSGERNFHFTENGADVVLTYFVRKWPCD